MASKMAFKTTFEPEKVIQPIFTGGSIALDNKAQILASTLGEDAVLTDITTGRHLATIEGDGEPISTLTLTPSSSHLIISSRSLSLRIYTLAIDPDNASVEATLTRTLKPHGTPVVVLAVDRTSTLLATGAADGAIKVWDIVGGYVTHTFRGPSVLVSALRFFEVAATAEDIKGQKKKKGKKSQAALEAENDANSTTVNFRLASGSQDGRIRVWDLHKRAAIGDLESHVSDVTGIDYSAQENSLITASRDKTIIWWDVRTWQPRKIVPSLELVEAVGFLDDGRLAYSAGANGCVRLWESETGREVTKEQSPRTEGEAFVGAVYCAQQSVLVCVQSDHTLVLYTTPTVNSDTIPELEPLSPTRRISGTHDDIIDLGYLLPDRSLMALATNSEEVRVVSVAQEAEGSTYFGQDVTALKGHEDIVIALDTDWSGHWLATAAKDNTARLWRIDPANNSFTCYATFTGHAESLGAIALPRSIPPKSSQAYTDPLNHPPSFLITGSQDLTVKKWEVASVGQQGSKKASRAAFTRKAHEKDINAVDINSTGQLFASASQDKVVKIWSVQEGEVQGILKGHRRGVWSVRFAPADMPILQGEDGATSAGKGIVLTGSGDKTIKIWSLTSYTCIRTFEGHSNSVLKVIWLPIPSTKEDNEAAKKRPVQFASAGGDGLVKVWDANTGECAATLDNHTDRVWALAVKPGSQRGSSDSEDVDMDGDSNEQVGDAPVLASGSADSTITFWRDTSSMTQLAAAKAADELVEKEQELQNHMRAGHYREAIVLALQLNHPGRLLSLFKTVMEEGSNPATAEMRLEEDRRSLTGRAAVDEVIATLSDEQLSVLLLRLRDWNANARTAPVAQRILSVVVRSYPASRLAGLAVARRRAVGGKGVGEVLDALKAYTERHYRRLEELVDESYLVEYTLQEMDSLAPPMDVPAIEETSRDVVMLET
ncbi:hypothetical protein MCOR25_006965 [Pyricularia grisea]|nr:hypothetical protein MCOR25_006965 [Pyricularia grisea]